MTHVPRTRRYQEALEAETLATGNPVRIQKVCLFKDGPDTTIIDHLVLVGQYFK